MYGEDIGLVELLEKGEDGHDDGGSADTAAADF